MSPPAPSTAVKRDLTKGSLGWNLFRLAAPTAAGAVLYALYNLVDAFWLGKAGKVPLAAPGLAAPLLFLVAALGFGFGTGGTALVAQYTGAGRDEEADRAAGQTILLLCALVSTLALPAALLAPQLLALAQAPQEALPGAAAYLRVYMLGLPFTAFTMAYSSALRGVGDAMTVLIITAFANVVNLVLDPLLIFGLGGLPELGVRGAALASVIGQATSAAVCVACLAAGRSGLRIHWRHLKPDWPMIWKAVRVGVPAALSSGLNSMGYFAFQIVINTFGTTVVSALTVGWRVLHFFNWPMQAIASAAAPVVGQALGAGDVPLARRAVKGSARLYALIMLVPTVMLMWKGQAVARLFIDDADVVEEAGRFFLVVPWSTYFFGVLMVLMAAFYGSGHTWPATLVSLVRVAGLRLPAALLLAYVCGLGSTGAYLGMVTSNVVCAALALYLFRAGGWERAVVPVRGLPSDEG